MTIGQEEDDKAFEEWWKNATRELRRVGRRSPYYAESLSRSAWAAGVERGLELRGCLHPNCTMCKWADDA